MGATLVLARCQIILSQEYGCVLKIAVRSEDPEITQLVMSLVQSFVCFTSGMLVFNVMLPSKMIQSHNFLLSMPSNEQIQAGLLKFITKAAPSIASYVTRPSPPEPTSYDNPSESMINQILRNQ